MERIIVLLIASIIPMLMLAQPINDDPCNALALLVNEDCVFITVDNTDGTLTGSIPASGCGGLSNADVWYNITVPASGLLHLSTLSGTITDGVMALYAASSCDGPFVLIACDDDGGPGSMPEMHFTDLTPNSTLYLRVWGFNGAMGDFSLCAFAPLEMPEGDCTYLLEMTDSYGDGWGDGARVSYSISGSPMITDSLESGSYAMRIFGVNVGDLVTMGYAAGSMNNENGVRLSVLGYGPSLYSGSNISTNVELFSGVADCSTPAPSTGDCFGATTLCHDTIIPQGALTQGYEVDLTGANQGCLASGERQGLWTRFMIATDGTLAFTLTPETQSDFDFAIWGPMNTVVCPLTSSPVRCSYASIEGPTGLSVTAMDNSEAVGGDGRVAALSVIAGQQYLLYIDNFYQNSAGVALTWQLSDGATLMCSPAPEALFSASSSLVLVGEPVNFVDQSTNDPVAWEWTFTGGTPSSSTDQNPTGIVYDVPGCYDVSLTAFNPGGSGSNEQACFIEVDVNTSMTEVSSSISLLQELDAITIRNTEPGMMHATIFDAMGRHVLSDHGNGMLRLATSTIGSGPYVVVVRNVKGSWSRRVFISR